MKIKKGDRVLIISGKDRARTGKIIKALPKEGKVVVEGINIVKKHIRPRRQGEKGQIVPIPAPLPISKVKLICPKCNQATRVGFLVTDKEKHRVCKKCKATI